MASEVDICNLALGHLGDKATVASLDPPEGSAQAEHCARFYPVARDALLEIHEWDFATKRALLSELENTWDMWQYAYAKPSDCLRVLAVLQTEATSDYSMTSSPTYTAEGIVTERATGYAPQEFACEIDATGNSIILTNQEDAVVRYTAFVTDTTRFSPLFISTLSWHLAALLAGPILKGDAGRAEAKRCEQMASLWLAKATASDSNQRKVRPPQSVAWMVGR